MFGPIILLAVCLLVSLGAITYYSMSLAGDIGGTGHRRKLFVIGVSTFLGTLLSAFIFKSLHFVPSGSFGIIDKIQGSRYLAPHQMIAREGEGGIQSIVAAPGWHFHPWPLHKFNLHPDSEVPQGSIGIIEALDGKIATAAGRERMNELRSESSTVIISPHIWDSNVNWLNPDVFLADTHGYRGIQNPPLSPGKYRLHPHLFRLIIVDTTVKSLWLAERSALNSAGELRPPMETSLDGVTVWINAHVNYQIQPSSAHLTIQKFGTESISAKSLDAVESQIRILVRQKLRSIGLLELDEKSGVISESLRDEINNNLNKFGIQILSFGITSIYDKESGLLEEIRNIRGMRQKEAAQIETENAKLARITAQRMVSDAESALAASRLIADAKAQEEALAIGGTFGARLTETRILAGLLGREEATRLLRIREAVKANVPIVPQTYIATPGSSVEWEMMKWIDGVQKSDATSGSPIATESGKPKSAH
jgi:hypothetical protein